MISGCAVANPETIQQGDLGSSCPTPHTSILDEWPETGFEDIIGHVPHKRTYDPAVMMITGISALPAETMLTGSARERFSWRPVS
jgi:hypothetical protein